MELGSLAPSAMIFDFDGVILESAEIKTQAFIELFRDVPEQLDAIVAYHKAHVGMSRYKKFAWVYERLLKRPVSQGMLQELGARFSQLVFDKILRAPFVPGAIETLSACRETGVPAFVISGTPHDELTRIIQARGLERYISEAWGSPTEKPAAIREIRARYGFLPNEMLFVGDGLFDYQAAAAEGVPFVARESGDAEVDWRALGVLSLPDLRPLAAVVCNRPEASLRGALPALRT